MALDGTTQHLVLMKGFPATRKSALAHRLSRALGWPVVDKDDIKDHTLHLENGNEIAYEIMWSITRRQLSLGLSVIVDSPLTYPIAFDAGSALAEEVGAHLYVVETKVNETTWREWLENRDAGKSEHKIAGWQAMQELLSRYDGCWQYAIPSGIHITVDTSRPWEAVLAEVLAHIRSADLENAARRSKDPA